MILAKKKSVDLAELFSFFFFCSCYDATDGDGVYIAVPIGTTIPSGATKGTHSGDLIDWFLNPTNQQG